MYNKLQSFNIKGERCSGTTYLQKLVETNLNIPCIQEDVGWKHGFLNLHNHNLNHSDVYLTIIIFRNAFDWLRSFYLTPHHLQNTKAGGWRERPSFSEFIRREVRQIDRFDKELIIERHPSLLTLPKNILELRKWKIEHFLNLKNVLPNTYYVNYEELITNPKQIVDEINDKWFKEYYRYRDWSTYKDTGSTHSPKSYFSITDDDKSFIIENTDWEIENKIGYYNPS